MDQEQYKRIEYLLSELLKQATAQTGFLRELLDAHIAPDINDLQPGEEANNACMYLIARQNDGDGGTQLTVFVYTDHKDVVLPTGKCYPENWGALPFDPETNGPLWTDRSTPTKQQAIQAGVMKMLPFTFYFIKKEKPAGAKGGIPGKPIDRTVRVADQYNNTLDWRPGVKLDIHQAPPAQTEPPAAAAAAVKPPPPARPTPNAPADIPAKPAAPAKTQAKIPPLAEAQQMYKQACQQLAQNPGHEPEFQQLYKAVATEWSSDLVGKGAPEITIITDPRQLTADQCYYLAQSLTTGLKTWRKWWDEMVKLKRYPFPEPQPK